MFPDSSSPLGSFRNLQTLKEDHFLKDSLSEFGPLTGLGTPENREI